MPYGKCRDVTMHIQPFVVTVTFPYRNPSVFTGEKVYHGICSEHIV